MTDIILHNVCMYSVCNGNTFSFITPMFTTSFCFSYFLFWLCSFMLHALANHDNHSATNSNRPIYFPSTPLSQD